MSPPDLSSWSDWFSRQGAPAGGRDWAATPLGPAEDWPASLKMLVALMLASPMATLLAAGERRTLLGNAAAARLIEDDTAFGQDATTVLARLGPQAAAALARGLAGEAASVDNLAAPSGASVDLLITPLSGGDGVSCVQALLIPARERPDPAVIRWSADESGGWLSVAPRWTALTGLTAQQSLAAGWLQAVHPDDRASVARRWTEARARGEFRSDHRVYDAEAKRHRWLRALAGRAAGEPALWNGVSVDIDDLEAAKSRGASALAEVRHRMRNTLGAVRSIARRMAETSESVEDYAMHLEGRLDALARAERLIAATDRAGVALDTLIVEELASFAVREDARLEVEGPALRIQPQAAAILGLAVHELATNAMKFGALTRARGKLRVSWRLTPSALVLTWRESGLSATPEEPRQGFGADLLDRGLAYRLNARTTRTAQPDGLTYEIELPLACVQAS